MAKRGPIQVDGTERLRRKLSAIVDEVRPAVGIEVRRSSLNVQAGARQNLSKQGTTDEGRLANSIDIELLLDKLDAKVGSNLVYAAAVEFGLPPGTRPPADAIAGWVRRKLGVADPDEARSIAFAIATMIERHGTDPQPYLHPAAAAERPAFRRNVNRAVKRVLDEIRQRR